MNVESYRKYCLNKTGVTEECPFGPETLVFKVMGKMFALTNVDSFSSVSLKCDPEVGADLRERYPAVGEAYHLNKRHWITVALDGSISDTLLCLWTDHSYARVTDRLSKSDKLILKGL